MQSRAISDCCFNTGSTGTSTGSNNPLMINSYYEQQSGALYTVRHSFSQTRHVGLRENIVFIKSAVLLVWQQICVFLLTYSVKF